MGVRLSLPASMFDNSYEQMFGNNTTGASKEYKVQYYDEDTEITESEWITARVVLPYDGFIFFYDNNELVAARDSSKIKAIDLVN